MKKIILLVLTILMMVGCSKVKYTKHQTTTQDIGVFEYDSCEYITIYSGVSHKGNCKFCKERDSIKWEKYKKELEELAIKLKEE
jgi:hypothetical protein